MQMKSKQFKHLTLVIHFLPKTGWFTLTTEILLNPGVSWIFGITVWDLLQYLLLTFMNLRWCPTALADAVIHGCYKTCKQLSLVVDPFTGVKILLWVVGRISAIKSVTCISHSCFNKMKIPGSIYDANVYFSEMSVIWGQAKFPETDIILLYWWKD